eukprot:1480320-Pyramimonas_sp.AAC.2
MPAETWIFRRRLGSSLQGVHSAVQRSSLQQAKWTQENRHELSDRSIQKVCGCTRGGGGRR